MEKEMIKIPGQVFYCDVDKTLCFDPSEIEHKSAEIQTVFCFGRQIGIIAHKPMVEFVRYMHNRGFAIIVHSRAGADWAEAVCATLLLTDIVTACVSKPLFYGDDREVQFWFGERVYKL